MNSILKIFLPFISIVFFSIKENKAQVPKNYWQQKIDYRIEVTLDTIFEKLHGFCEITYQNNSPHTIDTLYIHLWANAYNKNTALAQQLYENNNLSLHKAIKEKKGLGRIDSVLFQQLGQKLTWAFADASKEIVWVKLTKPIEPNQSTIVSTPFRVKIPNAFSRLMKGDGTYAITQWYPKVAAFDEDGWHKMHYLDQGEFYNNFGHYDVKITAPGSYVVAATGEAVTENQKKWINQVAQRSRGFKLETLQIPSSLLDYSPTKTWQFKQDSVIDFAWFASPFYLVEKSETILPKSNRKVDTYFYYLQSHQKNWQGSVNVINTSLLFFSKAVGDYGYNVCTVVEGPLKAGGGMEYPTITVIDNFDNKLILDLVIAHEVGHNWFYGMLATNERQYPWLDEGLNTFFENKMMSQIVTSDQYLNTIYPNIIGERLKGGTYTFLESLEYRKAAAENTDQAINTNAADFTYANYGTIAYKKTGAWLHYLSVYLGEEQFNNAISTFFESWKFKHPKPIDLKNTFEKTSGKDLSWFFDNAVESIKKPDFKIGKVIQIDKNRYQITAIDKQKSYGPIPISASDKTGNLLQTYWLNHKKDTIIDLPENTFSLKVNANFEVAEVNLSNNQKRLAGIFRSNHWPSLYFGTDARANFKKHLFWLPVIGYNIYDGVMIGASLHNHGIVKKHFEYNLTPLLGLNSANLGGFANIAYSIFPLHNTIKQIQIELPIQQFSERAQFGQKQQYRFFRPTTTIHFAKRGRTFNNSQLKFGLLFIENEFAIFNPQLQIANNVKSSRQILQANYSFEHKEPLLQTNYQIDLYSRPNNWTRISASGKMRIPFEDNPKKRFEARAFLGFMKANTQAITTEGDLRLSAFTGVDDFSYEGLFIARNENIGFWSRQILERDGNFHIVTPAISQSLGRNNQWLAALNLSTNLPGILPIRLFADIGTFADAGIEEPYPSKLLYVAGISLPLLNNNIEIFFPLIMSNDIKLNVNSTSRNYWNSVTFTLRFLSFKPLKEVNKII